MGCSIVLQQKIVQLSLPLCSEVLRASAPPTPLYHLPRHHLSFARSHTSHQHFANSSHHKRYITFPFQPSAPPPSNPARSERPSRASSSFRKAAREAMQNQTDLYAYYKSYT